SNFSDKIGLRRSQVSIKNLRPPRLQHLALLLSAASLLAQSRAPQRQRGRFQFPGLPEQEPCASNPVGSKPVSPSLRSTSAGRSRKVIAVRYSRFAAILVLVLISSAKRFARFANKPISRCNA